MFSSTLILLNFVPSQKLTCFKNIFLVDKVTKQNLFFSEKLFTLMLELLNTEGKTQTERAFVCVCVCDFCCSGSVHSSQHEVKII